MMKVVSWAMVAGGLGAAPFPTGQVFAMQAAAPESAEVAADAENATGEIIVTAQRRSERARDVPISLTVADALTMERAGVSSVRELELITPGLRMDRHSTNTQPSIRGITTKDSSPGNEANVAIYVDGVYQPVASANAFEFPDVVRVEVLKGPQGTLFGRNATGGAIQIFTRTPGYEFGGNVTASYASYDDRLLKGYVNIPLVNEVAALSLAGIYQKNDGYFRNLLTGGRFGGIENKLIKGKLLVEPAAGLSLLLAGQYSDRDDGSYAAGAPLNGNSTGRLVAGAVIPTRPFDIAVNESFIRIKNTSVSLKVEGDLGFATANSITAYNKVEPRVAAEGDFTSANASRFLISSYFKTFTQELTLNSAGSGPLTWVAGLFYYHQRASYDPNSNESNGVIASDIYSLLDTKAYAAFGEISYAITDAFTIIAGLRYSYEKRKMGGIRLNAVAGVLPPRPANLFPPIAAVNFDGVTPRLSLRYAVAPLTNLYFTYSQGFKSGGFNTSSISPIPFRPEKVYAYEVGVKTAPDPSFSLNAAAFYYDYKNQQVPTVSLLPNGTQASVTANAASSEIYGVEADAVANLSPEFSAKIGVSLLHARYAKFPGAQVVRPRLIGGVPCRCGNVNTLTDASGNHLIRSPDYTVSVGLNYKREFDAGMLDLSSSLYFSDRIYFDSDERIAQPAYATVNARASFTLANSGVRISVFGKNLTDNTSIMGTSILPFTDAVFYAPPRTYGAELSLDF